MAFNALTNPASVASPATIAFIVFAVLVGVAAFVLPLTEMRRRLLEAKRALADAAALNAEQATADLYAAVEDQDYERAGQIKGALDALMSRRELIRRASTLLWETGVASGFATTLLAPIAIWLITATAGRLLGL